MSSAINVDGVSVPAVLANRFNRNSHERSPFSYSKPTPGEPTRHTRIPVPRVLNYANDEEKPYTGQAFNQQNLQQYDERVMPNVAHLQYNSPADLYSRQAAEEQFVQQIGSGSIPLPNQLPEKSFDPNRSATLKYIREGDQNGYGPSLEQQIAAVEQPREYKSPEPLWANYAREKSERARSMTPGYRAQSEPRDTWTYEYRRDSSKTPARDIDWKEFQERTKTYVHDTKGGGMPYWAHPEFNQPNSTHRDQREKTPKGYECGGMDYRGNIHFDPPGPYDYVYTTRRKEEKRFPPGYEIGGTDFGTGYVAPGPYHGHGPDPPRRRTKYSADPNAPVNVTLAPNVDDVDPHLLVGDTVSNMKTGKEKGTRDDGYMGLSFRPTEGFKREHRRTSRRPEPKQDNTFCTNYTRRSRSVSAPRSIHQYEQRNVWNRENQDPGYYNGGEKTVNIHTLLNDEALVPKKRETTPTWREKSLEKHYNWEHREDPLSTRPMTWTREPNWTRTVQERRGAWEDRSWDTEARLALPASAKVRSEPPPFWQHNAQQKQDVWQNAANQMGSNAYSYSNTSVNRSNGLPPHQSQISAQNYQNSHSYHSGDTNADFIANTGFNKTQYDYLEERRQKYGPGGHGGSGQVNNYSTNTVSTTQSQPQMHGFSGYNQQQYHQEQRETKNTTTRTTNVQNQPVTKTTTYSYSQQPSGGIQGGQGNFQMSQSSTTHTVRETSQPAAPIQNYQQQQYYQERREKTTSEERTSQPVQTQQQFQQQHQQQQQKIREETVRPAQWWEQQQQQRRETKTTREETIRPAQVQQQWHEQRHQRREETRTETVQPPPQPVVQQQSWQQQDRREEKTTREERQPVQPVIQQQQWQQQSRREEKTTREETQPVQPAIQQQYWQQQSRREEKTTREETHPVQPVIQQQQWQQHSRREEKTTREETQPTQPVVQQQHWQQQQSRREERTTREETRPIQPAVQQHHYQVQQQQHKRTENKQSFPVVTSNSGNNTTVVTSGPPIDRKLEMSERLPMGSVANTHANTEGSYRSNEGHDINYKRDLQTSVDPGREMALLKEEERRVVENELEPGVISRHITTKYYKKKTVTDTTTTTQNPSFELFQAGRTILTSNHPGRERGNGNPWNRGNSLSSKSLPNVHQEINYENYEQQVDFIPQNLTSYPSSAQDEFHHWTQNRYAQELRDQANSAITPSNYYHREYQHHKFPVEAPSANRIGVQGFHENTSTNNQNVYQQAPEFYTGPIITSELTALEVYPTSPVPNHQQLNQQQHYLPLNNYRYDPNNAQEYHGEPSAELERNKSSTPSKRSKSEPRSMNGSFIEDTTSRDYGTSGKVVSIPTLLDGSALATKRYKVIPYWYKTSLNHHQSWKNLRDPYVSPKTGADRSKPYWANRGLLRQGAWDLHMRNHHKKLTQLTADHYEGDPPPVQVYSTNRYTAHGAWPTVASHIASYKSQPNLNHSEPSAYEHTRFLPEVEANSHVRNQENRNENIGSQQWKHENRVTAGHTEQARSRSSSEKPVSAVQPVQSKDMDQVTVGWENEERMSTSQEAVRATLVLPPSSSVSSDGPPRQDSRESQSTVIENPNYSQQASNTITQSQFL